LKVPHVGWNSLEIRRPSRLLAGIEPGAQPNEWVVKGNAPVLYDGRLMYEQKFYTVSVTVRDAMDSLSPAHREVLELSYRGDLKQTDIAQILGIPLGTVKTRSYYALRALKLALQERGIHD